MIDAAYAFHRQLVEATFAALTAEGRVRHFADQPRAHKLVQRDVEQEVTPLRPAIQLYPANKLPLGDGVFDVYSGLVAVVSADPDEVLELASDLDRAVEPYGGEPKMSGFVTTEHLDGPGYEVVLFRYRFNLRRE